MKARMWQKNSSIQFSQFSKLFIIPKWVDEETCTYIYTYIYSHGWKPRHLTNGISQRTVRAKVNEFQRIGQANDRKSKGRSSFSLLRTLSLKALLALCDSSKEKKRKIFFLKAAPSSSSLTVPIQPSTCLHFSIPAPPG